MGIPYNATEFNLISSKMNELVNYVNNLNNLVQLLLLIYGRMTELYDLQKNTQ